MIGQIYKLDEDGREVVLATYTVVDGRAVGDWRLDVNPDFVEDVEAGVYGLGGVFVRPSDGEAFVEALDVAFSASSRINGRTKDEHSTSGG